MDDSTEYAYVGGELGLFMKAHNWKDYWSNRLRPLVHGHVLDVGAGLGSTFDYLQAASDSWTCLEPDASLCEQLSKRLSQHERPPIVRCGGLDALAADERFDTIVYIDVIEHIEHDHAQAAQAAAHLRPGGTLIVLSPALPFLYSPFDKSVGHWRRYTRSSLAKLTPEGMSVQTWFFLDGIGVLASAFARMARRGLPTASQIEIWDKTMVPVSKVTDALTSRLFGRSIVMAWVKA